MATLCVTYPTPRPVTITVSDVNLVDSLLQRIKVLEGDARVFDWNNRAMVRQLELFEDAISRRDSIINATNLVVDSLFATDYIVKEKQQ